MAGPREQAAQEKARQPAAERLAETLIGRIKRGEYAGGEWLPTERELAAEFRADRSTIRTAFSALAQKDLIVREPGRRSRVTSRAEGTSSPGAGAMPQLRTLAVLSPQTPHYHASPAIQCGALYVLRQRESPYHLIVLDNDAKTRTETFRRERQALEAIRNGGMEGAIIWHQGAPETVGDLQALQQTGLPLVMVDRYCPEFASDFVGIDNVEAAKEAVNYLLDLGHTRIGHLTMRGDGLTVHGREQGYREALMARGIVPAPHWIFRMSDPTRLQPPVTAAADHFFSLPEPPTAVFAMNDLLAHSFLDECLARNVRVPEQISVMGFDDVDEHAPRLSPLTTVHQPFERMGQKAMELLLERLDAPAQTPIVLHHVLLPTRLVLRSSCLPLSETR